MQSIPPGGIGPSFPGGRTEIQTFVTRKWSKELHNRLFKELWAFTDKRIAVRYAYEYNNGSGNWFRAYGNENWKFVADGLMHNRHASIRSRIADHKFRWPPGNGPDDHPSLSDLEL
jgi:nuclear transport factor 2 (NTF2) superfamily protein